MSDRFTCSVTTRSCALRASFVVVALLGAPASSLGAQTDYYNTDRGRPVRIEDAYTTERYAFELKLAPMRIERRGGGVYDWDIAPEIAYGILPRTQVEIGLPFAHHEVGTQRHGGFTGLELSVMHNLNAETEGWPALGLRADVLAPVGSLAPEGAYPSLTGMVTRTFGWGRVHLNGTVTAGSVVDPASDDAGALEELSRWLLGAAIDRTFPLRSTLVTAELYGRKAMVDGEAVQYIAGVGARHQLSPTLALDAGIGRRLNGDTAGWYLTFGSAYAFSVASLFPTGR